MPRRAAATDEVGGDDRLAVPGRERVRGTPEERDGERRGDRERAQVPCRDQPHEAGVTHGAVARLECLSGR